MPDFLENIVCLHSKAKSASWGTSVNILHNALFKSLHFNLHRNNHFAFSCIHFHFHTVLVYTLLECEARVSHSKESKRGFSGPACLCRWKTAVVSGRLIEKAGSGVNLKATIRYKRWASMVMIGLAKSEHSGHNQCDKSDEGGWLKPLHQVDAWSS